MRQKNLFIQLICLLTIVNVFAMEAFTMYITEDPSEEDTDCLSQGLLENAFEKKNLNKVTPFGIFVWDEEDKLVGGCNGVNYFGSLYIDQLWVRKSDRQQGIGSKLLQEAEKYALEQGCKLITLVTMDFEAKSFYEKRGFVKDLERSGFDNDSTMYFFVKYLD